MTKPDTRATDNGSAQAAVHHDRHAIERDRGFGNGGGEQPVTKNGNDTGEQPTTPLGRVVATERKPNTSHEFHFWTAVDAPIGIGTIVRVDGAIPVNGIIPRVFGVVVEGFGYSDLQTPLHDVLSLDGTLMVVGFTPSE